MKKLLWLALASVCITATAFAADPPAPRMGDERVLLRTTRGDLVLALYPDVAPKTVAQFLKLVRLGVYDSVFFHRIEPNFVAQLTDAQNRKRPLSPEQLAAITKLPAEFSALQHKAGVLSMARQDADVNSAETSFSILLAPAPHLDGKYTIFGQLEFGAPLLTMLVKEPRDARNAPADPPIIEQALVKNEREIAELRSAGELRPAQPMSAAAVATAVVEQQKAEAPRDLNHGLMAGIGLIMLCNLAVFLFGSRWSVQTQGAVNMMAVLIGAFLLFAQYGGAPKKTPLVGLALFFGVVGLFKLMNRFEAAPRPQQRKS
jgi:cyclophilin family peptidyl-prolyl cis-trans isomerase